MIVSGFAGGPRSKPYHIGNARFFKLFHLTTGNDALQNNGELVVRPIGAGFAARDDESERIG
jgi:hypothetical protein